LSEKRSHVELQRVRAHYLQPLRRQSLPKKFCEPRILFDRQHTGAGLHRKFRQSPEPGTNFHHVILRRQLRARDNPAREIAVVQEVLAERLNRRDANLA
jgi:hypothetical protein